MAGNRLVSVILLTCALLVTGCLETPPSQTMQTAIKSMFVTDYGSYRFRGAPVGNFGAGTIYEKSGVADVSEHLLIAPADGLFREGADTNAKADALKQIVTVGSLGSDQIKQSNVTELGLQATAPNLYQIVNASGNIDAKSGVNLSLSSSGGMQRSLNWTGFKQAARNGLIDDDILRRISSQNCVIVSQDLTLIDFQTQIDLTSSADASLKATLTANVGKVVGNGTGAGFTLKQTSSNSFHLVANTPVVVAQQFLPISKDMATDILQILTARPAPTVTSTTPPVVTPTTPPVTPTAPFPAPIAPPKPILIGVTIVFHTNDDDKDFDTRVSVHIMKAGQRIAGVDDLAHNVHFVDNSTAGPFALPVQTQLNPDQIAGCTTQIYMQPNGHDTWKFDFTATFTFSDGTTRTQPIHGVVLSQDHREGDWTW